jgi:hypothetical protein
VLAAYAALVAAPLLLLFFQAARPPAVARTTPVGEPAPTDRGAAPVELPPFDAFSAADAPPFPDLELQAVADGRAGPLSAALVGPAIVHLWSLACESCADEWLPFERLVRDASTLGLPPIVSVLVVPEAGTAPAAVARELLEAARRDGWFGRRTPTVSAPWAVAEERVLAGGERPTAERPITGYPETFLLDGRRRIRLRLVGPMPWDADVWRRLLESVPDLREEAAGASAEPDSSRRDGTAS